jgi:hypothetical protein
MRLFLPFIYFGGRESELLHALKENGGAVWQLTN